MAAVAAALAVTGGLAFVTTGGGTTTTADAAVDTVEISRGDLTESVSLSATLEPARSYTVSHQADPDVIVTTIDVPAAGGTDSRGDAAGSTTETVITEQPSTATVTSLPEPGDQIIAGEALYHLDGKPVILLPGEPAIYRTLNTSTDGPEALALETALVNLGFDPGTIDENYTNATAAAVADWQTSTGQTATGTIPLGTVVFGPATVTVAATIADLGQTLGDQDPVLALATSELVATIPLDTATDVSIGDEISIRLPDRTLVTGTIKTIATDTTGNLVATAEPHEPIQTHTTPIDATATIEIALATDALLVPAEAIVHLEANTNAVRLPDGTLEPVEILAAAGGITAVESSNLEAGLLVRNP